MLQNRWRGRICSFEPNYSRYDSVNSGHFYHVESKRVLTQSVNHKFDGLRCRNALVHCGSGGSAVLEVTWLVRVCMYHLFDYLTSPGKTIKHSLSSFHSIERVGYIYYFFSFLPLPYKEWMNKKKTKDNLLISRWSEISERTIHTCVMWCQCNASFSVNHYGWFCKGTFRKPTVAGRQIVSRYFIPLTFSSVHHRHSLCCCLWTSYLSFSLSLHPSHFSSG